MHELAHCRSRLNVRKAVNCWKWWKHDSCANLIDVALFFYLNIYSDAYHQLLKGCKMIMCLPIESVRCRHNVPEVLAHTHSTQCDWVDSAWIGVSLWKLHIWRRIFLDVLLWHQCTIFDVTDIPSKCMFVCNDHRISMGQCVLILQNKQSSSNWFGQPLGPSHITTSERVLTASTRSPLAGTAST